MIGLRLDVFDAVLQLHMSCHHTVRCVDLVAVTLVRGLLLLVVS